MVASLNAELMYLVKDERHEFEKPYQIAYEIDNSIAPTNMVNKGESVTIHEFELLTEPCSWERYGFSLSNIKCDLQYADYFTEERVQSSYYPQVRQSLQRLFPDAAEIQLLEHRVNGVLHTHDKIPDVLNLRFASGRNEVPHIQINHRTTCSQPV